MAPLLLCQKSWKCSLGFSKNPNSPSLFIWIGKNYTQPKTNQHFKIQILNLWINSQNLYPNLSFSVKNKMANSHKKGWSHFKLNINDWDIPFRKILRICQWIGKNIFSIGENGMNPLGILPIPQNVWPKGPQDIHF